MRAVVASAALFVLGAAPGACGNADNARNQFIGDFCEVWRPCCQMAGLRDDGGECRLNLGAFSGDGFDPAAADACLAETRAAAADPVFCGSAGMETGSCRRVFPSTGMKAPGETCADDDECAPPSAESETAVCARVIPASGEIRKCQVRRRGQTGDTPCVGTVDGALIYSAGDMSDVPPLGYLCHIDDGLRCDEGGACGPLRISGETCQSTIDECARDTYCDLGAGMCADRKAPGAGCLGSEECAADAYCRDATLLCTARLADGATCATSDECLSASCIDEVCRPGFDNLALLLFCGARR